MGHIKSVQTTIGVDDMIAAGSINRKRVTSVLHEDESRELSSVVDSPGGRAVSIFI